MPRKSKKIKNKEILLSSGYTKDKIKELTPEQIEVLVAALNAAEKATDKAVVDPTQLVLFENMEPLIEPSKEVKKDKPQKEVVKTEVIEDNSPRPEDPGWTEHVLSFLAENEMVNGSPKVDALRRICLRLLGPFSEEVRIIQTPEINNDSRATAVATITFRNSGLVFTGSADACSRNCDLMFSKYPVSVAETRAIGRGIRKALMLVNIIATEEATDAPADSNNEAAEFVSNSMINSLKHISSRLNIDLLKLALHMNFVVADLTELNKRQALNISNELSSFSTSEKPIPNEILL